MSTTTNDYRIIFIFWSRVFPCFLLSWAPFSGWGGALLLGGDNGLQLRNLRLQRLELSPGLLAGLLGLLQLLLQGGVRWSQGGAQRARGLDAGRAAQLRRPQRGLRLRLRLRLLRSQPVSGAWPPRLARPTWRVSS